MKRNVLMTAVLFVGMICQAQTAAVFKPYRDTKLRLPSVPLLVSDPYFSIWSPYDRLSDGSTKHWTDAEKPLSGILRVDGKSYRFMGEEQRPVLETILPMSDEQAWEAQYTRTKPVGEWQEMDYDAQGWTNGNAAFGSPEMSRVATQWGGDNTDIYVRRTFNLDDKLDLSKDWYVHYSHDDVFELYINGRQVVSTGETWKEGVVLKLTEEMKKMLHRGKNVIAAHCHNTTGGAYVDFGLYRDTAKVSVPMEVAKQKSVNVLATSSYYTFACGPVLLDVVFTAPQLIDNLDLLSTPINYISYRVRSLDKKLHNVQLYVATTPEIAVNEPSQPTVSTRLSKNGIDYVKAGTIDQPICAKKGDGICIDWGYAYLAGIEGKDNQISLGDCRDMKQTFVAQGTLLQSSKQWISRKLSDMPAMAYAHNFGKVGKEGQSGYLMVGYDDIYSLEYMYDRRMAYWKHDGKVDIFQAFEKLRDNYQTIMNQCQALDKRIYDDAFNAGGEKYAEICSGSYRQVISAHKLFTDNQGHLLFFSKENNSNGCVNTVDLTYPSAPLFLVYNPDLEKAMMTSIFEYSRSGRWIKPFAAHDLGTYPIANGQVYGGDMPLEEAGNMLTLAASISKIEGNTDYVKQYWDLLTTWTDYLVENGQDPTNQLCTDDFAGHWAHNANLSVKAIMGIAGYSEMARMQGLSDVADKYAATAKEMAAKWESLAAEGDHYRLAFDRADTWSQKYNMVWDKMWKLNLFPNGAMDKEVKYYLGKQNVYGLPLDCRKDYTKSDWVMWTAAMAPDKATFQRFVDPIYKYINETSSRVPISDWHDTVTAKMMAFKARSVIGGYWMKVLMDKELQRK
ncbi:MAG: DUF4965 domain-containing protein [Bacteroidales bacterium]|nr:DUF4965 domain-containing protein [Bacteroidales bacterium]